MTHVMMLFKLKSDRRRHARAKSMSKSDKDGSVADLDVETGSNGPKPGDIGSVTF